jgi:S1-C subfamily serine protease
MMQKRTGIFLGLAFGTLCILSALAIVSFALAPNLVPGLFSAREDESRTLAEAAALESDSSSGNLQTELQPAATAVPGRDDAAPLLEISLEDLYDQVASGVVNIQVVVQQNGNVGTGAGSGFVIDREGHIVTNNHVVDGATRVSVIYYDGIEARATVVGKDADSDLAVLKVEELPSNIQPLSLGDSDLVDVGEWVIAIGNPFGQQSSMTLGIVSAVGRTIPTGVTPFSIPQVIQTDAAINPGNSGGPLLNLSGEVIAVNAQIVANGTGTNSGVGFSIPSNIVRIVAPVLIEEGSYQWPWLGVEGSDVTLAVKEANGLDTQLGAYINGVVNGGPAESAGIQGSSGVENIDGLPTPVGGDVIVEANGVPITSFSDLLVSIAFKNPGETVELTVIRDGVPQEIQVELAPRDRSF